MSLIKFPFSKIEWGKKPEFGTLILMLIFSNVKLKYLIIIIFLKHLISAIILITIFMLIR